VPEAIVSAVEAARRPLRLALVCARYVPFVGGIELHVHAVAGRLARRGVEVSIITTNPGGRLPGRERIDGVEVRRVRAWPAERDYYVAPGLLRELVARRYDVVHVQGYQTFVAPIALLTCLHARLPTVLSFHGGGHSSRLRQAIRPLQLAALRPLLARIDRLVALAPFELEHYARRLRLPRDRFVVIPNGSDLPMEAAAGVDRDRVLLASLGRLERYKGHHRVLDALPHVLERRPGVRLWIGGTGPEEGSLRRQAAKLGIGECVDIHGIPPDDRARMARELASVDTVISLSEFETQPIAALEALSLGCKLIVAASPGLSALADAGLATAVAPDAAPAVVAEAIVDALDRPAATDPPALPSWDDCADALLALYEQIAAAPAGYY
jgi:glycosyltransferase involved in cell wall biosynthesis